MLSVVFGNGEVIGKFDKRRFGEWEGEFDGSGYLEGGEGVG